MSILRSTTSVVILLCTTAAMAQDPYECDDRYAPCGTPEQSGGGGGGGGGGSILVNNTDLGETYQYADDYDDDGIEDPYDNCAWVANADQLDDDGDNIGTACDNCPTLANVDQSNIDGDALGDRCDDDMDGDNISNSVDLCVERPDPLQKDTDGDAIGDACDDDIDADGINNLEDNCVMVANPAQADTDPDIWGDACDDDDDGDGIRNTFDNCLAVANYDQSDRDADERGDACDADKDGDGIVNRLDNCPSKANDTQDDADRDGVGEACDDRYCYVVDGNADSCLDPTDPFTAYAPPMVGKTGEEVRLRLFGNHSNQAIRYAWEITKAPTGSRASIKNPAGAASWSTPYEYHYQIGQAVEFVPDQPGSYELRLMVDLAWEDAVTGEVGRRVETTTTLDVSGEPQGRGCSTVPFGPAALWTVLPLLGLAVRRRQ